MKTLWVLIILQFSTWGNGLTKNEQVAVYSTKQECEEARDRMNKIPYTNTEFICSEKAQGEG